MLNLIIDTCYLWRSIRHSPPCVTARAMVSFAPVSLLRLVMLRHDDLEELRPKRMEEPHKRKEERSRFLKCYVTIIAE
jgi:hypothetical protein